MARVTKTVTLEKPWQDREMQELAWLVQGRLRDIRKGKKREKEA